jgi:putative DNA primase/helicase
VRASEAKRCGTPEAVRGRAGKLKSENIYTPNNTGHYPASLTGEDHWQLVKLDWSCERQKFSKTPISARTSCVANSDGHGIPFAGALAHLGSGTVLGYRHPDPARIRLGLIDCDNCVAADGMISPRIQSLLRYMDSYAEYSVSGTGIHCLCWLDNVPADDHKDQEWNIEFYWERNVIPVTGNRVCLPNWESPNDVMVRTTEYVKLHAARFPKTLAGTPMLPTAEPVALSPDEILGLLFREPQGRKWQDLWDGQWQPHYRSPSDADLALLMKLAFYTGKDPHMMNMMFSASPLAKILIRGTQAAPTTWKKPKWENQKYREMTIRTAIEKTTSIYKPRKTAQSANDFYEARRQQINEKRNHK